MFNLIDDYNHLFERRLEGLLLGEALEDACNHFEEAKKEIISKKYDYLDHRNADFNDDFDRFIYKTDSLKDTIATLIERDFDTVWETPQSIRFLVRFEKVSEKIPLTRMDEKYTRILRYVEKEVDRILKTFRKQRDDPPLARNFPPIAGRIHWCRALKLHITELMDAVMDHSVLSTQPLARDLDVRYNNVLGVLQEYEDEIVSIWLDQDISVADACLLQPLLCLQGDRLFVNLHPTIPLLIREAKMLARLKIELPIVAATLMSRHEYFLNIQDSLNVSRETLEHLLHLSSKTIFYFAFAVSYQNVFVHCESCQAGGASLVPAAAGASDGHAKAGTAQHQCKLPAFLFIHSACCWHLISCHLFPFLCQWTNQNWTQFYERCKQAIEMFEVLVARVHDIYSNRILNVLMWMQDVSLQILPAGEWAVLSTNCCHVRAHCFFFLI